MGKATFYTLSNWKTELPQSLMANEVNLKIGDKNVRADSVLYDKNLHPQMIMNIKHHT